MKNSFIKLYMNPNKEFRTSASLTLFGTRFTNVNVKIDTGCSTTTILASRLGIPKTITQKLKKQDCNNTLIKKDISFGVNDSPQFRQNAKSAFQSRQYEQLPCVSFVHEIKHFEISGTPIENTNIKVNYDRTGNILIGMDIISTWDTHIGTLNTGETLLLACPKNRLNFTYFKELEKFFNLKPSKTNATDPFSHPSLPTYPYPQERSPESAYP